MRNTLIIALLLCFAASAGCNRELRRPAVAGAFYPADPKALSDTVEGYLAQAPVVRPEGRLVALVSPHAGYRFSGAVAGCAFRQVQGADYDTVIILGPSHHYPLKGASVYTGDGYLTPLGEVRVDKKTALSFLSVKDSVVSEPKAHEKEHSIEVMLPFLQKALGRFRLVAVVVGSPEPSAMDSLSDSIAGVLSDSKKKALLVVSTDWSHYKDYDTANAMDGAAIRTVKKLSSYELMGRAQSGEIELCGIYPMMLAMDVANKMGADTVKLFRYANSGDTTGERGSVVGYAAMGIYRSGGGKAPAALTRAQEDVLLRLARRTVEGYVSTGAAPEFNTEDPVLASPGGAFVTLKKNGRLRGCIGRFFSDKPLYDTVRDMAVSAAAFDRRFTPVTRPELDDIEVEISVLSPMRRPASIDGIEVGRDGLYIIKGRHSGVLLPQVPVEYGWDRETFLAQTCRKAGLAPDAWKQGAEIYVFTAEVFSERRPAQQVDAPPD